jgi:rhodanese-related sulfurtransferase
LWIDESDRNILPQNGGGRGSSKETMMNGSGEVVDLDREEIKRALADGSILLVDVREPHEFAMGHIPGSISHPLSTFDPGELPAEPGRRIVFSCAAGVRSVRAIELAQDAGLPVTEHYRGGFKDWALAGESVEET